MAVKSSPKINLKIGDIDITSITTRLDCSMDIATHGGTLSGRVFPMPDLKERPYPYPIWITESDILNATGPVILSVDDIVMFTGRVTQWRRVENDFWVTYDLSCSQSGGDMYTARVGAHDFGELEKTAGAEPFLEPPDGSAPDGMIYISDRDATYNVRCESPKIALNRFLSVVGLPPMVDEIPLPPEPDPDDPAPEPAPFLWDEAPYVPIITLPYQSVYDVVKSLSRAYDVHIWTDELGIPHPMQALFHKGAIKSDVLENAASYGFIDSQEILPDGVSITRSDGAQAFYPPLPPPEPGELLPNLDRYQAYSVRGYFRGGSALTLADSTVWIHRNSDKIDPLWKMPLAMDYNATWMGNFRVDGMITDRGSAADFERDFQKKSVVTISRPLRQEETQSTQDGSGVFSSASYEYPISVEDSPVGVDPGSIIEIKTERGVFADGEPIFMEIVAPADVHRRYDTFDNLFISGGGALIFFDPTGPIPPPYDPTEYETPMEISIGKISRTKGFFENFGNGRIHWEEPDTSMYLEIMPWEDELTDLIPRAESIFNSYPSWNNQFKIVFYDRVYPLQTGIEHIPLPFQLPILEGTWVVIGWNIEVSGGWMTYTGYLAKEEPTAVFLDDLAVSLATHTEGSTAARPADRTYVADLISAVHSTQRSGEVDIYGFPWYRLQTGQRIRVPIAPPPTRIRVWKDESDTIGWISAEALE